MISGKSRVVARLGPGVHEPSLPIHDARILPFQPRKRRMVIGSSLPETPTERDFINDRQESFLSSSYVANIILDELYRARSTRNSYTFGHLERIAGEAARIDAIRGSPRGASIDLSGELYFALIYGAVHGLADHGFIRFERPDAVKGSVKHKTQLKVRLSPRFLPGSLEGEFLHTRVSGHLIEYYRELRSYPTG